MILDSAVRDEAACPKAAANTFAEGDSDLRRGRSPVTRQGAEVFRAEPAAEGRQQGFQLGGDRK
jgi:hypothetical protein